MPVGGGGLGPQGVLQPPVEPLDQPVGLRMVSCRGRVLDVEQAAQARKRADVNWAPLSEVMVAGTPKGDTHPAKRALAQSTAVMEASGMASGHLDVLSMMVNR